MFGVQCQNITVRSHPRACGRCNFSFWEEKSAFSRSPAHVAMSRPERRNQKLGQRNSTCTTRSSRCCSTHTFEPRRLHFLLPLILVGVTFAQVALTLVSLEEGRPQEREERCNESGRRRHRVNKKAHTHTQQ